MNEQEIIQTAFDYRFFVAGGSFIGVVGVYLAAFAALRKWLVKGCVKHEELDLILDDEINGTGILQKINKALAESKKYTDDEREEFQAIVEDKINESREHAAEQLMNHKERSDEKDEADKKWLNTLQEKIEAAQTGVGEAKEAIKGIRERIKEGF